MNAAISEGRSRTRNRAQTTTHFPLLFTRIYLNLFPDRNLVIVEVTILETAEGLEGVEIGVDDFGGAAVEVVVGIEGDGLEVDGRRSRIEEIASVEIILELNVKLWVILFYFLFLEFTARFV